MEILIKLILLLTMLSTKEDCSNVELVSQQIAGVVSNNSQFGGHLIGFNVYLEPVINQLGCEQTENIIMEWLNYDN